MAARKTKPRKWAPSARDQEIFLRVERDGLTQRQAATEFGVSQPRIHKILANVESWLEAYRPKFVKNLTPQERMNFVRWHYYQVIDKLWRDCMATWNESLKDEEDFEERVQDGKIIRVAITRPRRGRLDCLRLAIRCTDELARLKGFDANAWIKANQKQADEAAKQQAEEAEFRAMVALLLRLEKLAASKKEVGAEGVSSPSNPSDEVSGEEAETSPAREAVNGDLTLCGEKTCGESAASQNASTKLSQASYQRSLGVVGWNSLYNVATATRARPGASTYAGNHSRAGPCLTLAA